MDNPVGPVEALEIALGKELEAERTYNKLAADYPAAKEILLFLAGEEQKHQRLIKEKIAELTS